MGASACRETYISLQAFFFLTARSESPFPFRGRAPELPRKTHARRSRLTRSSAGVEGAALLGGLKIEKNKAVETSRQPEAPLMGASV